MYFLMNLIKTEKHIFHSCVITIILKKLGVCLICIETDVTLNIFSMGINKSPDMK